MVILSPMYTLGAFCFRNLIHERLRVGLSGTPCVAESGLFKIIGELPSRYLNKVSFG